jgi:hypothetical protein
MILASLSWTPDAIGLAFLLLRKLYAVNPCIRQDGDTFYSIGLIGRLSLSISLAFSIL